MRRRLSKRVGILVVVIASLVVGTTVLAQGPFAPAANPIDAVLAKLDQIIEMLVPPDPPAAGPVVLSTGVVLHNPATNQLSCFLVNLGTDAIPEVVTWVVASSGSAIAVKHDHFVEPGKLAGFSASNLINGSVRCRFSFVGFASDVRATLGVSTLSNDSLVALDAR